MGNKKEIEKSKEIGVKRFDSLGGILKLSGILALFTGMFGLGFQKGIIWNTQLGNLNGSYDVQEVFNSAIIGGLYFFNLLYDKKAFVRSWELFFSNWAIALTILLIVMCIAFIVRKYSNDEKNFTPQLVIEDMPAWAYWGGIPVVGSFILAIILFLAPFVTIILIVFLIVLCGFGYLVGESWLVDSINKKPCQEITDKVIEQKRVVQCTQLYFKGKHLMGEVILENSDGYIIRRNDSFLFYSKDGNRCFYSKFISPKENKIKLGVDEGVSIFKSVDPEITAFCSNNNL